MLLRWLRLWPLILRLAVAGLALLLARSLWPNRPDRQFSLGLLAGTLPMVGFIGGSFNNDALALAWGALSFLLLALPDRGLITLLVLAAGPIFIDRSLLFYWPVALIWLPASGEELKPHRRTLALALVLVLGLLLTPNPRWAGGWQRFPALAATRDADLGLRLHDARPDYRARIVQIISGKRVLSLRDQTVMLEATFRGDPGAPLHLRLADSVHAADILCPAAVEPAVCRLPLTIHPHASQLRLLAAVGERGDPAATGDISLRLRLLAPDGEDLLFNGDASQPAPLGSPIFTGIEALLPLASGYFDQALTPAAWDAPAQFRYALFAGFTWVSFWGYFGWLSRPLPWLVYALPAGFSLLAGWGLFRGMMAALARQKRGQIRPEERVLALALLAVGLVLLQIWAPMLGQAWQPQGRYLFPALLPIVFLLLLGAETALPPRWRVRLPGLLFGGLLVLNGVSWLVTAR